jgi:hypothetical protein
VVVDYFEILSHNSVGEKGKITINNRIDGLWAEIRIRELPNT